MNRLTRIQPLRRSIAALSLLCSLLFLHCGGDRPAPPLDPTTSLVLSPSNPQIAMGTAQQFSLRALTTDGRNQELTAQAQWLLQDESGRSMPVAADGFLQIERPGRYTVTASFADRKLSTPISVTAATLSSVALSPRTPSVSKGSTISFSALATFSDGTTQDVTAMTEWSVKDVTGTGVATIDTLGMMQARAVGSARVTARYQARSSWTTAEITAAKLSRIEVSPVAPTIAAGTNLRFSAQSFYSDGSTADVSSQVTWAINDVMGSGVASIDSTGTASGLLQGQALITAELGALSGSTLLTIGPGVPVRLYFSSAPTQAPKGTTARFVAMADLSDGGKQDVSGLVTWTATDVMGTSVASVGSTGLVSANNVGKATIGAALRGLSVSASFEVKPVLLTSIRVTPTKLTLSQYESSKLTATGTYSDGSQKDLSATVDWVSSDLLGTAILSTAAGGKITAKNVGKATVTATVGGFSASVPVEVKAATVTSVMVSPFINFMFGPTLQLEASARLSSGGMVDVTDLATWTISVTDGNPADWSVSKGLVAAKGYGQVIVTATFMGASGATTVLHP